MAYWGEVEIIQNSQSISGNYTNVTVNYYAVSDVGSAWSGYTTYPYLGIYYGGQSHTETQTLSSFNFGNNKKTLLGSITMNIPHNSDGTMTVSASFTWDSDHSLIGTVTGSAEKTLTTIPRYMDYVWISQRGRTSTSISIDWSTSHPRDWTQYSINGGAWTDAGDVITSDKTGYFTVGGLNPNTTYSIKIKCRRTDSGLWSESGSLSIKTYQQTIPSISLSSKTSTSITVSSSCNVTASATHYRIRQSGGNWGSWQTSATFTGLSPNTTYIVQVEKYATESKEYGYAEVRITTYQKTVASISLSSKTVNSITVTSSCNVSVSSTRYAMKYPDGVWSSWQTSPTFTGLSPNTTYVIQVEKRGSESGEADYKNLTVTTYEIAKLTSAPNINIGESHTVKWDNPSGASISLKLCKTDNTQVINYGTVTGTSKSITPTASTIYNLIPNDNSITLRYIITTTANGTSYTNYKNVTFTVTNSNPTFSNCEYRDAGSSSTVLTGNDQIFINGYNILKVVISTANKAVAKNGATMDKYRLVCGNQSIEKPYSSNSEVVLKLDYVTDRTFMVYAIDSRKNSSAPVIISIADWKDYFKPVITAGIAERTEQINKETRLTFSGKIWNDNFGAEHNRIFSCKYEYKKTTDKDTDYQTGTTEIIPEISGNTFSASVLIKGDADTEGFEITNSYNIKITIADRTGNASRYNVILNAGTPGFALHKNGVAFGAPYNETLGGSCQVDGCKLMESNIITCYSRGMDTYGSKDYTPWVRFNDFLKVGNKLSIDEDYYDRVVIGKGVSYVEVSGTLCLTEDSYDYKGDIVILLCGPNGRDVHNVLNVIEVQDSTKGKTYHITPCVLSVGEGYSIAMGHYTGAETDYYITAYSERATHLTVKVVG